MSYHEGPTSPTSYEADSMSPVSQRTPKRRRVGSGDSLDLEPFHHSPSRYSPSAVSFDSGVYSPILDGDMSSSLQIGNAGDSFLMSDWDADMFWGPPLSLLQPASHISPTPTQNQNFNPTPHHNQSQSQSQNQLKPQTAPQTAVPTAQQSLPQSNNAPPNLQSHPAFGHYYQTPSDHMQLNMQPGRPQPDHFWNAPPAPHPVTYRPMPPTLHRHAQDPNSPGLAPPLRQSDPSMWTSPPFPQYPRQMYATAHRVIPPAAPRHRPVPAPPAPRRGGISLALSRANTASIEALPEHKRECPACQLEFECDDYLAVISCCGTATHAACMSAWVNSQAYAKTKVCMKCRKLIDARKSLNNIVPPVTDKSWDRGPTFTAPDSVQADTTIEFDITGRSDSATKRQYRREMAILQRQRSTASVAIISETDVPARSRGAYRELLQGQRREMDELEIRYQTARHSWRAAFEAEAQSASAVSIAKERYQIGSGQPVNHDINTLSEAVKTARKEQEQRHIEFRALSRENDEVKKRHQTEQLAFLQRVTLQMRASEAHESSSTSSEEVV